MSKKKVAALFLAGAATLGMNAYVVPASDLLVETTYGSVEIPGSPERVCVLDVSALDTMDTLDLGEYVSTVMYTKKMPSYLEEYYNSDNIIVLQQERSKKGESTDTEAEETDPYELYYSIDAELIIGTADTVDEGLYEVLSQIAPTVVLGYAMDQDGGMYEGVKENARTIASIWGVEDKVDELTAEYDAIYEELDEKLEGIQAVMLSSSYDTGRLQAVSAESEGTDASKASIEKHGQMLRELGVNFVSDELPQEVADASVYEKGAEEEVMEQKRQVITAWTDEAGADYVFLTDGSFTSLEDAKAAGYSSDAIENMKMYQDGKVCEMSADGNNGTGGLNATFLQLNELKAFFLG